MTRSTLKDQLQTQPHLRVWQLIRNLSRFNFIFGGQQPIPQRSDYKTDGEYERACVELVEGLADTFHMPDDREANESSL